MSTPHNHVCKHEWMRALGKRKMHLMLCPEKPDFVLRTTACRQVMMVGVKAGTGERCQVCERSHYNRPAFQPDDLRSERRGQ